MKKHHEDIKENEFKVPEYTEEEKLGVEAFMRGEFTESEQKSFQYIAQQKRALLAQKIIVGFFGVVTFITLAYLIFLKF